jgi:hypothetical protein
MSSVSVDRLADHFVSCLFDRYQGMRHVRRVVAWIGLLLKAVERVSNGSLHINHSRQVVFEYRGRRFKVRYDHQASLRGGIDILEVLPGRGAPDGQRVIRITNLDEAEDAYHALENHLDDFIASPLASPVSDVQATLFNEP